MDPREVEVLALVAPDVDGGDRPAPRSATMTGSLAAPAEGAYTPTMTRASAMAIIPAVRPTRATSTSTETPRTASL